MPAAVRMALSMAHTAEFTEKDVLERLARARKPFSLREIAAAMGIRRAGRHILAKMIPRLEKRGEIEEIRTGRYALAKGRAPLPEPRQTEHASARSAQVGPTRMGRSSSGGRAGAGTVTG